MTGDSSGGSAAIRGFFFQLLGHLDQLLSGGVVTTTWDGDDQSGQFVFEAPSGADAEQQLDNGRIYEQYKYRSAALTWSQFVKGAIGNLCGAARDPFCAADRFRLITNAEVRDKGEILRFLESCRGSDSKTVLGQQFRIGNKPYPSALDVQIKIETMLAMETADQAGRDRLLHCLRQLEICDRVDPVISQEQLTQRLRGLIEVPEGAGFALDAAMGKLMAGLAKGPVRGSASEILELLGLQPILAVKKRLLMPQLRAELREQLGNLRYVSKHDVRATLATWSQAPMSGMWLVGPSGVGKTWHLAGIADSLLRQGAFAIWVDMHGNLPQALASVENRLTQLLGHTRKIDLVGLPLLLPDILQAGRTLVLLIDGVEDQAAALQLEQESKARGFSFVATLSNGATVTPNDSSLLRTEVRKIRPFSASELRRYLQLMGRSWTEISELLRSLLRQPLFAWLYANQSSNDSAAKTEFELLGSAWNRERESWASMQSVATHLAEIELSRRRNQCAPSQQFDKSALTGGWLRKGGTGLQPTFIHSRLRDFALAKALTEDISQGRRDVADVSRFVLDLRQPVFAPDIFEHLADDLLWLLPEATACELCTQLLTTADPHLAKDIVEDVLPRIGSRAFKLLLDAAKNTDVLGRIDQRVIGRALAGLSLGATQRNVLADVLRRMLMHEPMGEWRLLASFLSIAAYPELLPTLWQTRFVGAGNSGRYRDGLKSHLVDAMRSDLQWLVRRLPNSSEPERSELLALLALVGTRGAGALWREYDWRPEDKRDIQSALVGIHQYVDCRAIDFVRTQCLGSELHLAMTAHHVLTVLDPASALELLLEQPKLEFHCGTYRVDPTRLLRLDPSTFERWLQSQLSVKLRWMGGCTDLIPLLSSHFVESACQWLANRVDELSGGRALLKDWADLFGQTQHAGVVRNLAGTPLEQAFVALGKELFEPVRDHFGGGGDLAVVRRILMSIAGPGIGELLDHELRNGFALTRRDALEMAPLLHLPSLGEACLANDARVSDLTEIERFDHGDLLESLGRMGRWDLVARVLRAAQRTDTPMALFRLAVRDSAATLNICDDLPGRLLQPGIGATAFAVECTLVALFRPCGVEDAVEQAMCNQLVDGVLKDADWATAFIHSSMALRSLESFPESLADFAVEAIVRARRMNANSKLLEVAVNVLAEIPGKKGWERLFECTIEKLLGVDVSIQLAAYATGPNSDLSAEAKRRWRELLETLRAKYPHATEMTLDSWQPDRPYADSAEILDAIYDNGSSPQRRIRAMQRLASSDPEAAVEACLEALCDSNDVADALKYCELVLAHDPSAAYRLLGTLTRESKKSRSRVVGIALQSCSLEHYSARLRQMLDAENVSVGSEVARYLPAMKSELVQIAQSSDLGANRDAAEFAFLAIARAEASRERISTLKQLSGLQLNAEILGILESTDPLVIGQRDDPLCFRAALSSLPLTDMDRILSNLSVKFGSALSKLTKVDRARGN